MKIKRLIGWAEMKMIQLLRGEIRRTYLFVLSLFFWLRMYQMHSFARCRSAVAAGGPAAGPSRGVVVACWSHVITAINTSLHNGMGAECPEPTNIVN